MEGIQLTYLKIKKAVEDKDFDWFEDPMSMNIIGIRTADKTPNIFNDFIVFCWNEGLNNNCISVFPATTDPGIYWLENPMTPKGCAILKPGQYPLAWKVGKHNNKYRALVQCGDFVVFRDNDRDPELDPLPGKEETGNDFGINMHHAGQDSFLVDKWSAGCQVFKRWCDFDQAMLLVDAQIKAKLGSKFTYTLLEEKDFSL